MEQIMAEQTTFLETVMQNTVAVMTVAPQHRETWFNSVQQLLRQAEECNDVSMARLLEAVRLLLLGDDPKGIKPDLPNSIATYWDTIVRNVTQSDVPVDPTEAAVLALLNSADVNEGRHIIETNQQYLLTNEADAFMSQLLQNFRENPTAVKKLEFYHELLVHCKNEGIETTFNNVHRELVADAVMSYVNSRSPQEQKLVVEKLHEILFTEEADQILLSLIDQYQNDPKRRDGLTNHRALLRRCRADGIDRAFDGLLRAWQNRGMDIPTVIQPLWDELRNLNRLDDMPRRVQVCRDMLVHVTVDKQATLWAIIMTELAHGLARNPQGDRATNIEQAIDCYSTALEHITRDALPKEWAGIQDTLAQAYRNRTVGNRASNLEQALQYSRQALEVYTMDTFPIDWAIVQTNLAATYDSRILGEQADNIERAIHHYILATQVFTSDRFPEEWAGIHDNLAQLYRKRILGERAENLTRAVDYSHEALKFYSRENFPIDWAMVHHNLGIIYMKRDQGWREENLEKAIQHFNQALQVFTSGAYPRYWALTQNSLGNTYADRKRGERTENIEKAIQHYDLALQALTRESLPTEWALVQSNLGRTYAERGQGERAENVRNAIEHLRLALMVYSLNDAPTDYARVQENLGDLYFEGQIWTEALEAYEEAMAAADALLAASYSEVGRQEEISKTTQLYSHASYCLLQSGQPGKALVTLERGKTRLLAEALALDNIDLKMLSKEPREQLEQGRSLIHMLEAEMRLPTDTPSRRSDYELRDSLRQARAKLSTLVDTIRKDDPGFMPVSLDLSGILALVPEGGALVAPLITTQGSAVFVIPYGATDITDEQVVRLDSFTDYDLQNLLRGLPLDMHFLDQIMQGVTQKFDLTEKQLESISTPSREDLPSEGWIGRYIAFRDKRNHATEKAWYGVIESHTKQLWDKLFHTVHERLQQSGILRIVLMPSAGLQLLPLHAAWREDNGKKCNLLDDYEVTYIPSSYVMSVCKHRAIGRNGETALVAGINTYKELPPLSNAVSEAQIIATALRTSPLLDSAVTRDAIKEGATGAAYLHFSCHGSFSWNGNPLESAIYLAGDEPLTLADIIGHLSLDSARLVTISACETGITDVSQSPDEHIGLAAGFLQAGAPAVVSSLWTVDDRSTALLMERFYRNHQEQGMSYPTALREAQLWLRDVTRREIGDYYKSFLRMSEEEAQAAWMELDEQWKNPGDRPYASPFYWAAFTCTGV